MRFLLYIAILFVATACSVGNSYRHELDRAQSEMEHSPDKALERLNAIDVSDLSDSATIARWALLYSEAINRNRLAVPSDTIINIAVDYYRIHGDSSERRQAEAIRSAMAENSVPESGADPLLSARYLQKVRGIHPLSRASGTPDFRMFCCRCFGNRYSNHRLAL